MASGLTDDLVGVFVAVVALAYCRRLLPMFQPCWTRMVGVVAVVAGVCYLIAGVYLSTVEFLHDRWLFGVLGGVRACALGLRCVALGIVASILLLIVAGHEGGGSASVRLRDWLSRQE